MTWKYLGDGAFIPGVPARDIEDEEAKELGIVELLEASDVYEQQGGKMPRKAAGEVKEPDVA